MYKDYPAAYQANQGSALQVDQAFYDRLRERKEARTLIEQFEIPIRTGRAWKVPAGHLFRVTTPHGPQVGVMASTNTAAACMTCWAPAAIPTSTRCSPARTSTTTATRI